MLYLPRHQNGISFRALLPIFFILFISFSCLAEIQSQSALTTDMIFLNAIKSGQLEDVNLMIKNGIDVNQTFSDGITPLHAAVINNQENIMVVLIQAGANVNATDPTTQATPLHLAALYGRESMAAFLIEKGAKVDANMKFGITPLLVATQFNQAPIVQLLLDKKANIQQSDQEGFTALHFAAQNGDAMVARLLIDKGAKIDARDKVNKSTPLAIAVENNHSEVAQLLQEHGASDNL